MTTEYTESKKRYYKAVWRGVTYLRTFTDLRFAPVCMPKFANDGFTVRSDNCKWTWDFTKAERSGQVVVVPEEITPEEYRALNKIAQAQVAADRAKFQALLDATAAEIAAMKA
jgi:hypothetical protein